MFVALPGPHPRWPVRVDVVFGVSFDVTVISMMVLSQNEKNYKSFHHIFSLSSGSSDSLLVFFFST